MTDHKALAEAIERERADGTPGPWVCMKWGDGSSPEGITNVAAPEIEAHVASDLLEEDAARIARLPALETAFLELWARVQALEGRKLRLEGRLWSIGHAAGCETREDLMRSALDALPQPPETEK